MSFKLSQFILPPRVIWLVAGLALLVHGALAWLTRMPGVLTGEDEAVYLLLARQIPHLQYRDVFLMGEPVHAMYPPGYPALLALWSGIFGSGFDRALLLSIAASTGALLLAFLTIRRLWSPGIALLILIPLAINPYLVERAGSLASEALYMLLTMAALWGVTQGNRAGLIVAATAALMAPLTRSIGVSLLAALGINWIWGRRVGLAAALGAGAALTVGAWLAWNILAPGQLVGASYAADFARGGVADGPTVLGFAGVIASRVVHNVPTYIARTIPDLVPVPAVRGTLIDDAFAAVGTVAALGAGTLLLWRRWRAAALYLGASMVVLGIWPWHIDRFAVPLVPLLICAVVLGADHLVAGRRPQWRRPVVAAVAGIITLAGAAQVRADVAASSSCTRGQSPPAASCVLRDQASYFEALRYLRDSLTDRRVLLTTKRATAYYYTGRQVMPWQTAAAAGADGVISLLREQNTGYVLLASLHWADVAQLPATLEPNCGELGLVRMFPPRTYLFRVREQGESDDGSGCRALADHRHLNVGRDFDRDP